MKNVNVVWDFMLCGNMWQQSECKLTMVLLVFVISEWKSVTKSIHIKHTINIFLAYPCLSTCIHRGVYAHLPVGVFSNLRHNQLCALNVLLWYVVEGAVVTLWLLVATHGKGFEIKHGLRCWPLLNDTESNLVCVCVSIIFNKCRALTKIHNL